MKRLLLSAILLFGVGTLTHAATITVSKTGSANANTISGAVDLANSGDTIQILDSSTYSEDFRLPINSHSDGTILQSLTIEAASGQTPVLERPAGSTSGPVVRFGPGNKTDNVAGPFVIRGASASARMTIRELNNNIPCINSGQNFAATHAITVENAILERPTDSSSASDGPFVKNNDDGNLTLTNVLLKGRSTGSLDDFIHIALGADATLTMTNVDCSQANGATGASPSGFNTMFGLTKNPATGLSCTVNATNCNFSLGAASKSAGNAMAIYMDKWLTAVGQVTFTDCTFDTGGTAANPGPSGFEYGSAEAITLTRPTFVGVMGPAAFSLTIPGFNNSTVAGAYPSLTIAGAAGNKTNLDPLCAAGGAVVRVLQGDVTLTDCTSSATANHNLVDTTDGTNAAAGPINVTMDRCIWGDNAGQVAFSFSAASDQPCALTATNTIWNGGSSFTALILHNAAGGAGALTMNLTHCTMAGATQNIFVALAGSDPSPVANYCIFDSSQTVSTAANITKALSGQGNLCWAGDKTKTSWSVGEPADTLHVDPKLDATGHISGNSPACGAAVGSTLKIDVDGEARPQPVGSTPDIGADENQSVPVTLSTFTLD